MSISTSLIASRHWDFAVVGAGPAGALVSLLLASRGHSVLLLDHAAFPRAKVCGGCLNGSAIAALHAAGLPDLLPQLHASPLHSLRIAVGSLSADFPLPTGLAVSRLALDDALVRAAVSRGAVFLDRASARLLPATGHPSRTLLLNTPQGPLAITASLVLACDGLHGTLLDTEPACHWRVARASRIGVAAITDAPDPRWFPHIIHMTLTRHGYVGAVCVEDGRLNVAAALDPLACRSAGGPHLLIRQILQSAHLPIPTLPRLIGAPLLTRTRPRLGAHRVLALGDAAGYVEPFTGEGIAWAFSAAHLVLPFAQRALANWSDAIVDQWTHTLSLSLARRRNFCLTLTRLLRFPSLVSAGLLATRLLPSIATPIIRSLNNPALPRLQETL